MTIIHVRITGSSVIIIEQLVAVLYISFAGPWFHSRHAFGNRERRPKVSEVKEVVRITGAPRHRNICIFLIASQPTIRASTQSHSAPIHRDANIIDI